MYTDMADMLSHDLSLASGYKPATPRNSERAAASLTTQGGRDGVMGSIGDSRQEDVGNRRGERQRMGTGGLPASCFQIITVEWQGPGGASATGWIEGGGAEGTSARRVFSLKAQDLERKDDGESVGEVLVLSRDHHFYICF